MQIQPSVIKQLLQLQLQGAGTLSDSPFGASDAGTDFTSLLGALMEEASAGQGQASGGRIIPASELLARTATPLSLQSFGLDGSNEFSTSTVSGEGSMGAPSQFDGYIKSSSSRNGVDPSLVKAVIQAESDFNPKAVSHAGAKGLMQLMDSTGEGLGVRDPFNPQQNIEGGTRFLSGLLKKYDGNEGVALAAYNAGPGRVDRLGIKNDFDLQAKLHLLPKETQKYVSRVLGFKEQFQA